MATNKDREKEIEKLIGLGLLPPGAKFKAYWETEDKGYSPTKIEPKVESGRKHTVIAIHTARQFYGDNKQLTLFSDAKIDEFIKSTGIPLQNRPDSYGVVLNQSQSRTFEGILKAFSDTNYLGDEQIEKREELRARNINTESSTSLKAIEPAYSNIDKIPIIKLTQADIIRLSGYERTRGDKVDVVESINFLGSKQFCFYWTRLKYDSKGIPVKDKRGDYVKEEVMEVGTLFRIRYVKEPGGELKYYEISPSSVILDQVNKNYGGEYFLLIPDNWRDEVKQITGKKVSSYTYEFLRWLRLQYELKRQYNKKHKGKPFTLKKTWEEIAIALKMPETMYRRNRKRATKIIKEAYDTAIKLGYLLRVENDGATDILYLNEDYYPKPGELV